MKFVNKIIAIAFLLSATYANAETPEEAFWKSLEVNARIQKVKAAGFTHPTGDTLVTLKHEFRGPYGVLERSYLVSQVFAPSYYDFYKATNLMAIVTQNSLGKMIGVQIVELPKVTNNDFNGGSDEK